MYPKLATSQGVEILSQVAKQIAESHPRHRDILLVEHDPDLQWRLARLLTTDGNRVVGTGSAEGALTLLDQWRADLVLVAERLPGDGGLPLLETLRERFPEIPVILMAERRSDVQVKEPVDAATTLMKPFGFEALRSMINAILFAPTAAE